MTGGPSAILTYHSIDDSGSVISTPPSLFQRQMEFLAASGIPVTTLDRVVQQPGSVAITFDDGFANVAEYALPLLEQYRLPATIFVVSKFSGGRNNWPSQPSSGVPILPLLSWNGLRSMPQGVAIGAHTETHPDLRKLSPEECGREMSASQNEIEQQIGKPVRTFAYPYGFTSAEVRNLAARHFDLAVGTALGWLPPQTDRLELPRIDTYYLRETFPLERLFTPSGTMYILLRRVLREARRRLSLR